MPYSMNFKQLSTEVLLYIELFLKFTQKAQSVKNAVTQAIMGPSYYAHVS